jgi:hypothetical protein
VKELIIKVDEEKMDIEGNAPVVDRPQKLVRCKDCKKGEQSVLPNRHLWCRIHEFYREPEWFCADGEKRND